MSEKNNILLINHEQKWRKLIKFHLNYEFNVEFFEFTNFLDAIENFPDLDSLDMIIVDPQPQDDIAFYQFYSFIKDLYHIYEHKKTIPLVITSQISQHEINKIKENNNFLVKSFKIRNNINDFLTPMNQEFKNFNKNKKNKNESLIPFDKEFLPLLEDMPSISLFKKFNHDIIRVKGYGEKLNVQDIITLENSVFDFYIKENEVKKITGVTEHIIDEKIFVKGSSLSQNDNTKHLEKIKGSGNSSKVKSPMKVIPGTTEKLNDKEIYFIKNLEELSQKQITLSLKIVNKLGSLKPFIYKLHQMKELPSNKNKVLLQLTCLIAKELNWVTDQTYKKFIAASNLHDISLSFHPNLKKLHVVDGSDLENLRRNNPEDYLLWKNHSLESSNIIKNIPDIPQFVAEMVLSKHQYTDKNFSFPYKNFESSTVFPVAAVFSISLHITNYFFRQKSMGKPLDLNVYFEDYQHLFCRHNYLFNYKKIKRILTQ